MKAGLLIVSITVALLGGGGQAVAADIPRAPLDSFWESHMLAGTSYRAWTPILRGREQAKGSWPLAAEEPRGISLSDFSGTRLFGLLRGGGWHFEGGLLDQAAGEGGSVELYVKTVIQVYPGLIDNGVDPKEQSYEFFLLYRPHDAPLARIVRKWVIRPEEVRWYIPDALLSGPLRIEDKAILRANESSDVRGFLAYDPASKIASVTITGLKRPWEDRVDLSAAAGQ